ncbi:glycosyltransferase family 2 protein [Paenibacillus sp. FSL M7-1455]|uniref:Glycosyl transferase n=1 Tax=Paenibacillus cookii TaxID=157839 RepID=A0ABQ4LVY0_9BACL|nr:glycosyltransferase family 2 protein [Paenibacillus cookii]KHF35604.1 N-acetylglucosaminyl-diphospho-decaprenol L-rhamnosyltransferase [Paenibacillus sp. P1XP2]GIO67313.1 glycosyl transferase [Paenibacillus cookii]
MPLTSIVMLTRNGLDLTRRCVESVMRHTEEPLEWIAVDNGSTDGTLEFWNSMEDVKLIANAENRGFAAGNNQGMLEASGDFILLLNNDTVVTPRWLSGLYAALFRDPDIGIVGPVSNHVAPIQRVPHAEWPTLEQLDAYAARRQQEQAGSGFYAHKLVGFCMLFHRRLLERIGGFDERFFPGNYEDDDFSIRARIGGKRLWVAQDVFIHHEGQGTFASNRLDYKRSSLANAEKFRAKWSTGLSAPEMDCLGYNPSDIVAREPFFIPEKHFVPLGDNTASRNK